MNPGKCCKCGKKIEEYNTTNYSKEISNFNTDNKYLSKIEKNNYSECDRSKIESKNENTTDSAVMLSNSVEDSNNVALLKSDANTYKNIIVDNSRNVIIGNVTCISGPVYITQISTNIEEQNITNQLFLSDSDLRETDLNMISRGNWMAQPTKSITPLPEIAQYVIIAHTATEEGYTPPENALLVKLIQTFHIESRNWDDIGYNFLVGCDGNVYEGRGWNVQGAHTYGYNKKSICIAFIGCFMDHLPPVCALNAARRLIFEGVKLGFIPESYTLVGHCQCTPFESPGVHLLNEIKKWPSWRELTPEDSKF